LERVTLLWPLAWYPRLLQISYGDIRIVTTAICAEKDYRADSLAGLNHLHHLETQAAGATFTIKRHQNQSGSAGHISLISRKARLLIEAIRLVKKLATMVSPLVISAGCWRLDSLARKDWTDRNSRDGARKGKRCQGFLGVRRSDQAADTKSVNDQVTIARTASISGKPWKRATNS
jgi:hypothetical protein